MSVRRSPPAQSTSFVGRSAELALLAQIFERGARLVTVLGPPGIGKSRLSLRHAELRREGGGVFFCDLGEAAGAEDLCAAMSRAIDAAVSREGRGGDRVLELGVSLGRLGDALVVLDNAERVVACGPETIGRWLELAPRARLLVTSRERLRLAGEATLELGPLSLPEDDGDVGRAEAVQLFMERARAVRPSFSISAENAAAVAAIVRQLDGIPLAIELGASRMGVLSPGKLLERMPRRFDVLSAGLRNPTARQRTLREAIDTSWELLEPWEQGALAQLSVLRGGFSLEAAEAVVDLRGHAGAPALLDVVAALVDKSWLFTRSPAASPMEVRLGMYLSLRDYAAARLEASGGAAARRATARHAAYFLGVAATWAEGGDELAGIEPARRLARERENLIAAHRGLLAAPDRTDADVEGALRAALSLEGVLTRWGPIAALRAMLDDALDAGAAIDPALRARALAARAGAAHLLGRIEEARADHEAALAIARALGDRRMEGVAAAGVGGALRALGRLKEARRWLARAIPRLKAAGARGHEARARNALGQLFLVTGRGEDARAQHEEALRILRGSGDRELVAATRLSVALLDIAEGRLEAASAHLEEAHAAAEEPAPPLSEAAFLRAVALLRQEQGRLAEARASAEASSSIARRLGNTRAEGFALGHLGIVHAEMGDLAEARGALERAAALVRGAGDPRGDAFFTAALGAVRARLGDLVEAERLFAEADERLGEAGDAMLGAAIDLYRAELDLERAARAPDDGAAAPLRAAVQRRIQAARGGGRRAAGGAPAARSQYVRAALRILERRAVGGASAAAERPDEGALVISPDARWCRLPDGGEVVFKRGRALRLMLLRLVEERLRSPGRALPLDALFESGWPGERASPDAIGNRVYVGVSRLRKLGFQGLLLSRDDGFLLDPAVPSYRADRPR